MLAVGPHAVGLPYLSVRLTSSIGSSPRSTEPRPSNPSSLSVDGLVSKASGASFSSRGFDLPGAADVANVSRAAPFWIVWARFGTRRGSLSSLWRVNDGARIVLGRAAEDLEGLVDAIRFSTVLKAIFVSYVVCERKKI